MSKKSILIDFTSGISSKLPSHEVLLSTFSVFPSVSIFTSSMYASPVPEKKYE